MAAINPQAIKAPMLGMIIALRKRPNACTFVFIFFIPLLFANTVLRAHLPDDQALYSLESNPATPDFRSFSL